MITAQMKTIYMCSQCLQSVLLELIMKDTSKTEHMIGFIFYVQSHCQIKVSQNEFIRYENL
jgi:hypothetical protein